MTESGGLDPRSLDANRQGQLSRSQRSFVYRVGIRWLISAMFLTALGLLLVFAVGRLWFTFLGLFLITPTAVYLVLRSLDCIADSTHNRVAIVTGRATFRPVGTMVLPLSGWREDGWERATVGSIDFWLPPGWNNLSGAGEISVYFAPRSRVTVNVEVAASPVPDTGENR